MPDVSQVFQDTPTDQRLAQLRPQFGDHLQDLIQDVPGLGVASGYRSPEHQAQLWQAALDKYGSPAVARQWVAPPGHSNHNEGLAADLSFANPAAIAAAHAQAPNYGLTFPLPNENWHIEPQGIRGGPGPSAPQPAFAPPANMPAVVSLARPAAQPQSAPPSEPSQSQPQAAPSAQAPAPQSNPFASLAFALSQSQPQQAAQAPSPQVQQNLTPPKVDPAALVRALTQFRHPNLALADS